MRVLLLVLPQLAPPHSLSLSLSLSLPAKITDTLVCLGPSGSSAPPPSGPVSKKNTEKAERLQQQFALLRKSNMSEDSVWDAVWSVFAGGISESKYDVLFDQVETWKQKSCF